jgi:hypothetical protein
MPLDVSLIDPHVNIAAQVSLQQRFKISLCFDPTYGGQTMTIMVQSTYSISYQPAKYGVSMEVHASFSRTTIYI